MLIDGHPITNLNRIIVNLSDVGKSIGGSPTQETEHHRWLKLQACCNAAVIASVMLLRFACENKWTPEADWTEYARKKLTYGDVAPQQAHQLARKVFDQNASSEALAPKYTEEIIGILKTLITDQETATKVPFTLECHLFSELLLGAVSAEEITPKYVEEAPLKVSKQILSALSYSAELSTELWNVESFSQHSKGSRSQRSLLGDN